MSRKIFNYDNQTENKIVENLSKKSELYENSVSACGCLFYRFNSNKLQLLLISYVDPGWPKLDDLGGRIDDEDESIFDAIAREASEETNNIITKKFMLKLLPKVKTTFYNKQSKYFVVVHEVDNKFYNDTSVFGDVELADNIARSLNWIDYDVAKPKLSMRLCANAQLIKHLDMLQKNVTVSV